MPKTNFGALKRRFLLHGLVGILAALSVAFLVRVFSLVSPSIGDRIGGFFEALHLPVTRLWEGLLFEPLARVLGGQYLRSEVPGFPPGVRTALDLMEALLYLAYWFAVGVLLGRLLGKLRPVPEPHH
jgi:hypothetical protein